MKKTYYRLFDLSEYVYTFQKFTTIRTFSKTLLLNYKYLLNTIAVFNNRNKYRAKKVKKNQEHFIKSVYALYDGKEIGLNAFKSGIFSLKPVQGAGIKTLLHK